MAMVKIVNVQNVKKDNIQLMLQLVQIVQTNWIVSFSMIRAIVVYVSNAKKASILILVIRYHVWNVLMNVQSIEKTG